MNIEQLNSLLEAAESEHRARIAVTDDAQRAIDEADQGADLTQLRATYDTAATAEDEAAAEAQRCRDNLEDAKRRQTARDTLPAATREALAPARPAGSSTEPLVFSPQAEAEGRSFFAEAYKMQHNHDPGARELLERHGKQNVEAMKRAAKREAERRAKLMRFGPQDADLEEYAAQPYEFRDVGTGAFAGLTVPQYLIDLFAPLARAGSPALNMIARKLPLPSSGMTLNISRITTGSATAAQATENTGVQETDIDDTLLTVNVRTYAGQQDVSRQALERSEMVDSVVFMDMIADYFTKLDDAIVNADGTSGTHLGIRSTAGIVSVSYTDATPTVPELYPKLADAIRQINGGIFKAAQATGILMHSRRWGWGTASLDTQNRPLFVPDSNGPFNALAVGEAAGYGQVMGRIQGLPTITDDNIKTNLGAGTEDVAVVVAGMNLLFWQEGDGSPRQFRFEQTNAPQSVRLAVWGYSGFTAGRYPLGSAVVGGTGLIAPTF